MKQVKRIIAKSWCGNVLRSVDIDPIDTETEEKVISEMRDDNNIKFIYSNIVSL